MDSLAFCGRSWIQALRKWPMWINPCRQTLPVIALNPPRESGTSPQCKAMGTGCLRGWRALENSCVRRGDGVHVRDPQQAGKASSASGSKQGLSGKLHRWWSGWNSPPCSRACMLATTDRKDLSKEIVQSVSMGVNWAFFKSQNAVWFYFL